ncbi:MAG: sugar ABC transporter permease [Actinomycetota bacterium]
MGTLETLVSWALLLVVAAAIGLGVRGLLGSLQRNFAGATPLPSIVGTAAGIVALLALIDGDRLPFVVSLLVAALVLVAVWRVARFLIAGRPPVALAVAVLAAVVVAFLWLSAVGPTKLVGFAVAACVVLASFAVTGTAIAPEVVRRHLPNIGGIAATIGAVDYLQAFDRMSRALGSTELNSMASALWAVTLAVGGSALLFVGANRLADQSKKDWPLFCTLVGAVIGFAVFGIMDGNRLLQIMGPRESVATNLHDLVNRGPWSILITSLLIGAAIGLVAGTLYGSATDNRRTAPRIGMGIGASIGLLWGLFFVERIPVDTSVRVLWTALIGASLCAVLGYVIGRTPDDQRRVAIAAVGGLAIGLVIGGLLKNIHQPRLQTVPLIALPIIGGVLGVGLAALRRRPWPPALATGLLAGWILATFGVPTLGGGPEIETMVSTGVIGLLAGLRFGLRRYPDDVARANLEQRFRGPVFLAPALAFISLGLVVPLIRTFYLSLFDDRTVNWVGLENYQTIFTDPKSFEYANRLWVFGSVLFYIAIAAMAAAVLLGYIGGRRTGNGFSQWSLLLRIGGVLLVLVALLEYVLGRQTDGEAGGNWLAIIALGIVGLVMAALSFRRAGSPESGRGLGLAIDFDGPPAYLLTFGLFMLSMAMLSNLRGTLFNNLWWVITVTFLSTVVGLAVAVLADRASYESVAKSFVFMPLAISFVGASIIWRFMYIARDPRKEQTGVFNALWVELGKISTGGTGQTVGIVVLLAALAALAVLAAVSWRTGARGVVGTAGVLALPVAWALYRFTAGGGMGGTGFETETGSVQGTTILFLQDSQPFNNLWLMVVLIWIQTGFAMVIFSAAIKAVPAELIEAARMDGATESQVFWRVTLPQIAPTVGVVVTTLIVAVMKVFDIVKVMTNGNFETQVVANEMWQRAFTELNFGLGSALAVVLFLAVVPVMGYNIRRMQREL